MKRLAGVFLTIVMACGSDESQTDDLQRDDLGKEGLSSRQGCIEESNPITDEASPEFAEAQALLGLATGEHTADLHWRDGQHSKISASVANARAVKVESREDPEFLLDVPRDCADRVRVELDLQLTSDDGRLDEEFWAVTFERSGAGELSAWVHLKTAELRGAYVRQSSGGGELSAVYFSIEFGDDVFTGDISEETMDRASASLGPSVGTWSNP